MSDRARHGSQPPNSFDGLLGELADVAMAESLSSADKVRTSLWLISRHFYHGGPEIPKEYVSAFHKWWEENHTAVLGLSINRDKCHAVAAVFEEHFSRTATPAAAPPHGMHRELVANVRFFSAAQDFGGRFRADPFQLALRQPALFSPAHVLVDFPAATDVFLNHIGADAQRDKRHDFAERGARFLLDNHGGQAFNLYDDNDGSIRKMIKQLTKRDLGLGFSAKKANMFARDMFDWRIWSPGSDVSALDVAADANTMRIALRTGILSTALPTLLASYLDVYCYQYSAVDEWTVEAWRAVWEEWDTFSGNSRVTAPAFMDYFIYRLGRTTCKRGTRRCESSRSCPKLGTEDCPAYGSDICDGRCPFCGICKEENKKLQPPKSISRLGRTGWESGRTDEGGGLGISS